jgi:CRISPR-associated protein Cas2
MRRLYIVTYDICDPKRLRRVFKTMKGFGTHLQLSVFQCDLPAVDIMKMRAALTEIIHHTEDQVLIIDLGPTEARPIRAPTRSEKASRSWSGTLKLCEFCAEILRRRRGERSFDQSTAGGARYDRSSHIALGKWKEGERMISSYAS